MGMPRAPVTGLVALAMGSAFAGLGMALGGWVGMRIFDLPRAFEWAMWAGEQCPWLNRWNLPIVEFGNRVIQTDIVGPVGTCAFFLCMIGVGCLRTAYVSFLPADRSGDGDSRIEVSSGPARAGAPFEGRVWVPEKVQAGDAFTIRLKCAHKLLVSHRYQSGAELREEFSQEERIDHQRDQDARAVDDSGGRRFVPFRFDIPATAPFAKPNYWRLEVTSKKGSGKTWGFDVAMLPALGRAGAALA